MLAHFTEASIDIDALALRLQNEGHKPSFSLGSNYCSALQKKVPAAFFHGTPALAQFDNEQTLALHALIITI